jgi:hypothetical protein
VKPAPPEERRLPAAIRAAFEAVCAIATSLLQRSKSPTLRFGELELDLTGMSQSDVESEARRWAAVAASGAPATAADNAFMEQVAREHPCASPALRIAGEWAAVADCFQDWWASVEQARQAWKEIGEAIAAEALTALEAVCLAEAGRWAKAFETALRLRGTQWQDLVRLIQGGYEQYARGQ